MNDVTDEVMIYDLIRYDSYTVEYTCETEKYSFNICRIVGIMINQKCCVHISLV